MKEYKIRIYRNNFNRDRWHTFTVSYKESDLCIGIDTASYVPDMGLFAAKALRELRLAMEAYIANDPTYAVILSPYHPGAGAPEILVRMAEAAATPSTSSWSPRSPRPSAGPSGRNTAVGR
jgi:hypothetical protein